MIKKAFKMKLFAGKKEEYIDRHNPIWPALVTVLKSHGVSNYSIFLDEETNVLFGYVEIQSEQQWEAIAYTDICRQWWSSLIDLMETNVDDSPVSSPLIEVFHLD